MTGPVALIGAGEFLSTMVALDAELLAATGRIRPRVAILPTASAPDGEEAFQRRAAMGVEHFSALDAEVEAVLVHDRSEADDPANVQAIAEADLVYLAGGKPDHLLRSLAGSAAWSAMLAVHRRGGVLAGCAAGAMVLGGQCARFRRPPHLPFGYVPGLGVVPGVAVFPNYDRTPEAVAAMLILRAPGGTIVLGIDGGTAAVGRDGAWQVRGRSRVTVWRGRHRDRLRHGDFIRL
jgi:cyanophycinase-like exopeptidase